MKKTCLGLASLLLMILHVPIARGDDCVPAPIVFVKTFLQLSDNQTATLINILEQRNAAMQPIAARVHVSQQALGKLLESPDPDEATAGRLLIEIRAGERQLATIAQQAVATFEEVLSSEQRERLQFVRQASQIQQAIPPLTAVGLITTHAGCS